MVRLVASESFEGHSGPVLLEAAVEREVAAGASRRMPALHTEGRAFLDDTGKPVILRGVSFADLKELDTERPPMNVARLLDLSSPPWSMRQSAGCTRSWTGTKLAMRRR